MKYLPVLAAMLLALAATACGQKGPLYLGGDGPTDARARQSEPYRPLPYPGGAETRPSGEAQRK